MSCCASCDTGQSCNSSSAGYLGFLYQDDTIPPDVPNSADGSLDALGLTGLTQIVAPTFSGDWSAVDVSTLPAEAFGIDPSTLSGLGQFVEAAMVGAKFAPSVGQWIEHAFKLGAGRKEADIIVPNQNQVVAWWQTQQTALNSTDPNLVRQVVLNLQELIYNWFVFISDPRFVDGRASAQSANTLMPHLNGTCGYGVHNLNPAYGTNVPVGQDTPCNKTVGPLPPNGYVPWSAWPRNWGYGPGLLGAMRAHLVSLGGVLPSSAIVTQGVGVPTLQFPQTSGGSNLPPQAGRPSTAQGFNTSPAGGYFPSGPVSDWTSDPTTLALLGVAAFLIMRR
jgi:hypothetical protein